MAVVDRLRARLTTWSGRVGCSPSELAALTVLVAGALGLMGFLWWVTPRGGGPVAPSTAAVDAPTPGLDGQAPDVAAALDQDEGRLIVHVTGAVGSPGLQELTSGARVADALEAAGGPDPDAALDAVNLARPLRDGEHLHLHDSAALADAAAQGASPGAPPGVAGSGPPGAGQRVDVNHARADELEALPGVGPVLAASIVAHREEHGPFVQREELLDVSGIGEHVYEALVDLVDV